MDLHKIHINLIDLLGHLNFLFLVFTMGKYMDFVDENVPDKIDVKTPSIASLS